MSPTSYQAAPPRTDIVLINVCTTNTWKRLLCQVEEDFGMKRPEVLIFHLYIKTKWNLKKRSGLCLGNIPMQSPQIFRTRDLRFCDLDYGKEKSRCSVHPLLEMFLPDGSF